MSTSESCGVNGHTMRCTSPVSVVLADLAGVWLRANEMEISATLCTHEAQRMTSHCRQPSFSGSRFLHLELAPWVHRQRIYFTDISTSSENFPVPTFTSRHSSVVNIFSGPSSNDDYLGHSKNHDWLIDWVIDWVSSPQQNTNTPNAIPATQSTVSKHRALNVK